MFVRLGFAVAAHLEPDILIVDEVLAVGDIEFQKKCLGKMNDVSQEGRTVLLVSHNLTAIESMANSVIVLDNGHLKSISPTDEGISYYIESIIKRTCTTPLTERNDRKGNGDARITEFWLENESGQPVSDFICGRPVVICFRIKSVREFKNADIAISFHKMDLSPLFRCSTRSSSFLPILPEGESTWRCKINRIQLVQGSYIVNNIIRDRSDVILDYLPQALFLHVNGGNFYGNGLIDNHSPILVDHNWIIESVNKDSL